MIATAQRIVWTMPRYDIFLDDQRTEWNLTRDSPAAVSAAVDNSVRRWQFARIAAAYPQYNLKQGFIIDPLRKLLHENIPAENWGPQERGQLRSALFNR